MAATGTSSPRRRTARSSGRVSGEAREAAILSTLHRLLGDQPFHAISVDDLARGAGLSRPTFYFYFESKEAALLALLQGLVAEAAEAQGDAPDMLAHDRDGAWRKALSASYGVWIGNRDVICAAAEARSSDPGIAQLWTGLLEAYVDETAEVIEAERARGAAPPGIPARDLAICLNRMSERIYESVLGGDEPMVAEDRVVDSLVEVWIRAIYGTVES